MQAARSLSAATTDPYGKLLNRPLKDGPGYTGHASDAATSLSYVQQRYYDPQIGRFLSVDPVTVDSGLGANFNRYWYANNNPYRFTDPDGRNPLMAAAYRQWFSEVRGRVWNSLDSGIFHTAGQAIAADVCIC